MKIIISVLLLAINTLLLSMEPGSVSPKNSPEGKKLRELVLQHLNEAESRQAAAEPVKDSNYYKKEMNSPFRGLVNTPPVANEAQVMAGPLCIKDHMGVLCAAHMIFLANLEKNKILKTINIPSKLEDADRHRPALCCVEYAKISGIHDEQILLGEDHGRVLIADPTTYEVKTFGHVLGKVLGFFVDPKGKKIAVRYENKDEAGKTIPCFALAAAYEAKGALNLSAKSLEPNLAQTAINKRRSWAPPINASNKSANCWSHFANQTCNHEVKSITFEEDHCITHCATGNIEKWAITNLDTDPILVKVAQIEQRKP